MKKLLNRVTRLAIRGLFGELNVMGIGGKDSAQVVQKIKLCLLELWLSLRLLPNSKTDLRIGNPATENVGSSFIFRGRQTVKSQTNREKYSAPESWNRTRNLTEFCHE